MSETTMSLEDRSELSMTEYKAASEKGFVAAEAEATPEKITEPEAEKVPETTQDTEPVVSDAVEPVVEQIALPEDSDGVKKRIGKALERERLAKSEIAALQRQIDELKAPRDDNPPPKPVASSGKPTLDQFDSVEEFTDALTDWKLSQLEARKVKETQEYAIDAKINAAVERFPDFREVAFSPSVASVIQQMPVLGAAITESAQFAELAMYLGQNLGELRRIAALTPARALAEIGKLETRFETAKPATQPAVPKQAAPALPAPHKPVGGNSASTSEKSIEDRADMPFLEYKRLMIASRRA